MGSAQSIQNDGGGQSRRRSLRRATSEVFARREDRSDLGSVESSQTEGDKSQSRRRKLRRATSEIFGRTERSTELDDANSSPVQQQQEQTKTDKSKSRKRGIRRTTSDILRRLERNDAESLAPPTPAEETPNRRKGLRKATSEVFGRSERVERTINTPQSEGNQSENQGKSRRRNLRRATSEVFRRVFSVDQDNAEETFPLEALQPKSMDSTKEEKGEEKKEGKDSILNASRPVRMTNRTEAAGSLIDDQLEAVVEHEPLSPTKSISIMDATNIQSMSMFSHVVMQHESDTLMDLSTNSLGYRSLNYEGEDSFSYLSNVGSRVQNTGYDYSGAASISDGEDEDVYEFLPPISRNFEWMGRSVESLVLGHLATAPMLSVMEVDDDPADVSAYVAFRRRSTASTFGGDFGRRSSIGSGMYPGSRRGSLSLTTGQGGTMHGGTMANYFNRRRSMQPMDVDRSQISTEGRYSRRGSNNYAPAYRRRSTASTVTTYGLNDMGAADGFGGDHMSQPHGGPNIVYSLAARELTGKPSVLPGTPPLQCLKKIGGSTLYGAIDRPAAGMGTEMTFLGAAIDSGDWTETQTIVSRLAPRLIGDPSAGANGPGGDAAANVINDPSLPPSASPYHAGGGRLGLERDAFVLAGGVEVLMRIFREKCFVGQEMAESYDARDLSEGLVATRLAHCWNEALASLRELIFAIPSLVEDGTILDNGDFLPFLFTLLSHDSCFDGAAALIEEILSLMSHSPQSQVSGEGGGLPNAPSLGRVPPVKTFFLGNVPDLYELWGGFNCRQLAHFCRILALLVFEPEDRQLLESPAVLKSSELLQLRRNRAVRAGRDSTVDMNQAILLGDIELTKRLLKLLRVMNFAPTTRRSSAYHVMAHFPFIADTLVMLGLNELESWDELERLEDLARKLLTEENKEDDSLHQEEPLISELGSVADMLENLSSTLLGTPSEPTNQLSHIIHVISAAQQAGVVVDRTRQGRSRRRNWPSSNALDGGSINDNSENDDSSSSLGVLVDGTLASAASMLTDQVLVRRLYASVGQDVEDSPSVSGVSASSGVQVAGMGVDRSNSSLDDASENTASGRPPIANSQDAANSLQFNALLLGPYQVEVLFVLCTLLGGRRKIDSQEQLNDCGIISVLDDMFQRLPWHLPTAREQAPADENQDESNEIIMPDDQDNGIHGSGCECTPESALCVQYLRLLHNFCDRDCDNYSGRQNLLSESEKAFVLQGSSHPSEFSNISDYTEPGLLSKIAGAFTRESDESPYRFWLASCIESYLRGSSPTEQVFVAQSGLLAHLIEDITSERLHCAGSLQTSFDLLGELCKGNHDVLNLLVGDLDEEKFRKIMSVAAANLVDSNVFIRSLWLSLERLSASNRQLPLHIDIGMAYSYQPNWISSGGKSTRYYLTHSWWDTVAINLPNDAEDDAFDPKTEKDDMRSSDWFPTVEAVDAHGGFEDGDILPHVGGVNESQGHFGWVFSPVGDALSAATHEPNSLERLSWFLAANRARLLRDLLGVVDLRNINHENICCLNTAVVIAIFAHRRKQLPALLMELSQMNDEEQESKRRAIDAAKMRNGDSDDFVDRAFVQAMRLLDIDQNQETAPYSRRASLRASVAFNSTTIGDRKDILRNFREVLWFWFEYYSHRGRDRLSLEFSSHLRFQEWMQVVAHLVADDNSPTSLVHDSVRLPRSPYQSAAIIAENPSRGL